MPEIKTREIVKGTVKTLDKAAVIAERMKHAYVSTKERAEHSTNAQETSETEYAETRVESAVETTAQETVRQGDRIRRKAVGDTKENVSAAKAQVAQFKEKVAKNQAKSQSATGVSESPPEQTAGLSPPAQSDTPYDGPGIKTKNEPIKSAQQTVSAEIPKSDTLHGGPGIKLKTAQEARPEVANPLVESSKGVGSLRGKVENTAKSLSRAIPTAPENAARDAFRKSRVEQIRASRFERASHINQPTKTIRQSVRSTGEKTVKAVEHAASPLRQTAQLAEKVTVRTVQKGTIKSAQKAVKTAENTAKAAIKTAEHTAQTVQKTAQTARAAQRTVQAARFAAKTAAAGVKAAAKALASTVKAIIASTKALISALIAGGWIAVLVILVVVLLGAAISIFGDGKSSSYTPVSEEVEAYEPTIRKYAEKYGIPDYVELIKAVMMQESGGRGLDPMQCAEGTVNTRYPHVPNGIKDPEYSIECGVQELRNALLAAEVESPIDLENIKLALQGYNFGNGYISWANDKYGGYSYANAVEFSEMMAERMGWEGYGDTQYPFHVLRFYPYGRAFTGGGDQAIVAVALTQVGNVGGEPYWSWYGFSSREEWCACFVSWCADQCGYIDEGVFPKFSGVSEGVRWFQARGLWQDGSYEPQPGDIIFFDWDSPGAGQDGDPDHVGIVEKVEDGVVYTIEGNSDDACRQNRYAVGYYEVFGYGTPEV